MTLRDFQEKSSKRGLKAVHYFFTLRSMFFVSFKRNPLKEDWKMTNMGTLFFTMYSIFQEKSSKRGLKVSNVGLRKLAIVFATFKRNPLKEDWKLWRKRYPHRRPSGCFQEKSSKRGLKVESVHDFVDRISHPFKRNPLKEDWKGLAVRKRYHIRSSGTFKRNPLKEDWKTQYWGAEAGCGLVSFKRNPLKEDWKRFLVPSFSKFLIPFFQEKSSKRGLKVCTVDLGITSPHHLDFQEKSSKRGLKGRRPALHPRTPRTLLSREIL